MSTAEQEKAPKSIFSKWWVSILLAITIYGGLKYIAPALCPESSALFNLCQAGPTFAPLATMPFLLLAAKQLYDTDLQSEELEENEERTRED